MDVRKLMRRRLAWLGNRPALGLVARAVEMRRIDLVGQALGLREDELAMLEALARDDARWLGCTVAEAYEMRLQLFAVAEPDQAPSDADLRSVRGARAGRYLLMSWLEACTRVVDRVSAWGRR